jgi:hypothetical protein
MDLTNGSETSAKLNLTPDSSPSLWRWTWQRVPKRRQNLIWRRILHPAFEDGPDRGFRNVAKLNLTPDSSSSLWRWTWQRVPKRRQNLIWLRGNTQKKIYKLYALILIYLCIANCMILLINSSFGQEGDGNCTVLGCDVAGSCCCLATFRNNMGSIFWGEDTKKKKGR